LKPPYLEAAFAATANAFGLRVSRISSSSPPSSYPRTTSRRAPGTLANIPSWGQQNAAGRPNRQLQASSALYYTFPSGGRSDRYDARRLESRTGGSQQVLIAAREIDSGALPEGAPHLPLNRHSGLSPMAMLPPSGRVNTFGPDGLPVRFLSRIWAAAGVCRENEHLGIKFDASGPWSFPLCGPAPLYYGCGESAPYVIDSNHCEEFDFPDGTAEFAATHSRANWASPLGQCALATGSRAAGDLKEAAGVCSARSFTPARCCCCVAVKDRLEALVLSLGFET